MSAPLTETHSRISKSISIATVLCLATFTIATKAGVRGSTMWVLLAAAAVVVCANVAAFAYDMRAMMNDRRDRLP
jgi:membrane protein YdbS with pleckstrin-like domain